jgi:uncharacterized peroxidase-related enzyme
LASNLRNAGKSEIGQIEPGGQQLAHIEFLEGLPGIRGPLAFSPATTKPLCDLVDVLLYGPNTLTPAEREMIATYVSSQNDCFYCQSCHGSTAAQHLGGSPADYELIDQIKENYKAAPLSDKMKALLTIAGKVQKGGKHVTTDDVEQARQFGATDKEIHDTVLIAAAFCLFNRYVDGLATWQPRDPTLYLEIGKQTASLGYAGRDWKKALAAATTK